MDTTKTALTRAQQDFLRVLVIGGGEETPAALTQITPDARHKGSQISRWSRLLTIETACIKKVIDVFDKLALSTLSQPKKNRRSQALAHLLRSVVFSEGPLRFALSSSDMPAEQLLPQLLRVWFQSLQSIPQKKQQEVWAGVDQEGLHSRIQMLSKQQLSPSQVVDWSRLAFFCQHFHPRRGVPQSCLRTQSSPLVLHLLSWYFHLPDLVTELVQLTKTPVLLSALAFRLLSVLQSVKLISSQYRALPVSLSLLWPPEECIPGPFHAILQDFSLMVKGKKARVLTERISSVIARQLETLPLKTSDPIILSKTMTSLTHKVNWLTGARIGTIRGIEMTPLLSSCLPEGQPEAQLLAPDYLFPVSGLTTVTVNCPPQLPDGPEKVLSLWQSEKSLLKQLLKLPQNSKIFLAPALHQYFPPTCPPPSLLAIEKELRQELFCSNLFSTKDPLPDQTRPLLPQSNQWKQEAKLDSFNSGTEDWMVVRDAFEYLVQRTGLVPEWDLFADYLGTNSQTDLWRSRRVLKEGSFVDNSSLRSDCTWDDKYAWINPPFTLLYPVLEKAYCAKQKGGPSCQLIIIVPYWPDSNWWRTWVKFFQPIAFFKKGTRLFSRRTPEGRQSLPSTFEVLALKTIRSDYCSFEKDLEIAKAMTDNHPPSLKSHIPLVVNYSAQELSTPLLRPQLLKEISFRPSSDTLLGLERILPDYQKLSVLVSGSSEAPPPVVSTSNQDDVASMLTHGLLVDQPLLLEEDIEAVHMNKGKNKSRQVSQAILEQEALGYLVEAQPSEALCISPLFQIPKKGTNHLRSVLDCRLSNLLTCPKPVYLPSNKTLSAGKYELYTKLDLGAAFLSFKLHETQQCLFAVRCPLTQKRYKFTRLIWGSSTAPAAAVPLVLEPILSIARVLSLYPEFDFGSCSVKELAKAVIESRDVEPLLDIHAFIDDLAFCSKGISINAHRDFTERVCLAISSLNLKVPLNKRYTSPSETMVFLGLANTPRGLTSLPSVRTQLKQSYERLKSSHDYAELLTYIGTAQWLATTQLGLRPIIATLHKQFDIGPMVTEVGWQQVKAQSFSSQLFESSSIRLLHNLAMTEGVYHNFKIHAVTYQFHVDASEAPRLGFWNVDSCQGRSVVSPKQAHINILEFEAVLELVRNAPHKCNLRIFSDSQVVVHTIASFKSKNADGNRQLEQLHHLLTTKQIALLMIWIPTGQNESDVFTRRDEKGVVVAASYDINLKGPYIQSSWTQLFELSSTEPVTEQELRIFQEGKAFTTPYSELVAPFLKHKSQATHLFQNAETGLALWDNERQGVKEELVRALLKLLWAHGLTYFSTHLKIILSKAICEGYVGVNDLNSLARASLALEDISISMNLNDLGQQHQAGYPATYKRRACSAQFRRQAWDPAIKLTERTSQLLTALDIENPIIAVQVKKVLTECGKSSGGDRRNQTKAW